jgi:uncharacterized protein YbjT (DUF2867 family)
VILVTGANGKSGRAVIRALCHQGKSVRAFAHRPEQVRELTEIGAKEVITGDMLNRATVEKAYRGVSAVYHICPSANPMETAMGELAIQVAASVGVERFVYHSVLHPHLQGLTHHQQKLRVEEKLYESGIQFTILQPGTYMQNLLPMWGAITKEKVLRAAYTVDTRLSMTDLEDIAQAAALVLTEEGHLGASYELCGPEILSPVDMAGIISKQLGLEVRVETTPAEKWAANARASGLTDYQAETLGRMFKYYSQFGFVGNPNVLSWILKRRPTDFSSFVKRTLSQQ